MKKGKKFEQKEWFWPLCSVSWCGTHKVYWSKSHVSNCPYCKTTTPEEGG